MATDDGHHFTAPNLVKRVALPRPRVICDVCNRDVETWLAIRVNDDTIRVRAQCHGKQETLELPIAHWEQLRYESVIQLRVFIQTPQDV